MGQGKIKDECSSKHLETSPVQSWIGRDGKDIRQQVSLNIKLDLQIWPRRRGSDPSLGVSHRNKSLQGFRKSEHIIDPGRSPWASQVVLEVKSQPANAGDRKRCGFNPWVGEILWRRKWQPTPVFWPDNAMGRGAWRVTAHGVAKGRVWLKLLSTPAEVPLLHCGLQRQRRTVKTAADTGQAMVSWILQERALLSLGGRHHTGRLANRWPMIAKHPAWSWDVFFTVSYCYSYCCC